MEEEGDVPGPSRALNSSSAWWSEMAMACSSWAARVLTRDALSSNSRSATRLVSTATSSRPPPAINGLAVPMRLEDAAAELRAGLCTGTTVTDERCELDGLVVDARLVARLANSKKRGLRGVRIRRLKRSGVARLRYSYSYSNREYLTTGLDRIRFDGEKNGDGKEIGE